MSGPERNVFESIRPDALSFAAEGASLLETRIRDAGLCWQFQESPVLHRVKTDASIRRKLLRFGESAGIESIHDYIGLRVLVAHSQCLSLAKREVAAWAEGLHLMLATEEDRFANPGSGGYRALHECYAFRDGNRWGLPPGISVEVQITSLLQSIHADISRELFYKVDSRSAEVLTKMSNLGDQMANIDILLAEINWISGRPTTPD